MKKKMALFLVFSMTLAAVAGCGAGGGSADEPGTESSASAEKESEEAVSEDSHTASDTESIFSSDDTGSSEETAVTGEMGPRLSFTAFDFSKYTDQDRELYFNSFGNHILCTPDMEDVYPDLSQTLQDIADDEESYFANEVKENDSDALEYHNSSRSEEGTYYYSYYADDVLKRADNKCVSIVRVVNGYVGGAHPDYFYETYNIDTETGDYIVLSDVVKDQAKLNEILEQKLTDDYPDVEYFDLKESLASYDMTIPYSVDDENSDYVPAHTFTLDPDGVSFYFSPYGISAYAFGDQVVKILYDEAPELFKEDYSGDGSYVSYLTELDNKYAVGGKSELIRVEESDYDENDYFQQIDIYKGNKALSLGDTYYYGLKSFIVHTADGGDFVYVIANIDNDYKQFYAADLSDNRPSQVKLDPDMGYCYGGYVDAAADIYETILPTDPDHMELGVRCDMLSTYSALGDFRVTDSGSLELNDSYLAIPDDAFVLTSKMDLTADIVDEDGKVVDKAVTIDKGSQFTLYRTDGKSKVDAFLEDGRLVRLEVGSGYPKTVNGKYNEEELFDGLMYAG